MILGIIIAIAIIIGILYFTCGRLGLFINLIIYTVLSSLLPVIFPILKPEGISQIMYTVIRLIVGLIIVKRLFIIYERIDNPIMFFLTGVILEAIFTFAIYKIITNIYFKTILVVYAIASVAMLFMGAHNNELLNSSFWIANRQNTLQGQNEINITKAKRNLFWGTWYK